MSYLFEQTDKIFTVILLITISISIRILLQLLGQRWITTIAHTSTLVLLPILTFIITRVISGNIALSLGMVGALSIVRFRNPVRSPLELSVYFGAITMGIAASVDLLWLYFFSGSIILVITSLLFSQYLSIKIFKIPFFNTSFSEGNALSTLEVTTLKPMSSLDNNKFLTFKRVSDNGVQYIMASHQYDDLVKIQEFFINNKNIVSFQLNKEKICTMLRLCICLILSLISNQAIANCNFVTGNYLSELNTPKKIQSIKIEIPKVKKYNKNFGKILVSKSQNILPELKKSFKANVTVKYDFGKCSYQAKVKQNGDWKDHIKLHESGKPIRSLNIRLVDGNILNAVKFKLLIPETRNNLNEILGTVLLRELDMIAPETFQVNTNINDVESVMLFQEIPAKELLERNKRREGPLFEGDESILWSYRDRKFENFELEQLSLARMINRKWFLKGKNSQTISLRAFEQLQKSYLYYSQESQVRDFLIFPNHKNNYVFDNFFLTLIAMNGLHGLRPHNGQYYYNVFLECFEPIYYDGMLNLNKQVEVEDSFLKLINRNGFKYKHLDKLNSFKNSSEILKKFNNRVLIKESEAKKFAQNSIENITINILTINERLAKLDNNELVSKPFNEQIKSFRNFQELMKVDQILISDLTKNNEEYIAKTVNQKEFRLTTDDISKLISNNKLNKNRGVYIKEVNNNDISLYENKKLFDETLGEIIHSNTLEIVIDKFEKKISFKQKNKLDWVLMKNSNLSDWKVYFIGTKLIKFDDEKKDKQRFNSHGMTGCLNFYNVLFNKTSINALNGKCEDSVNIVSSQGNLKKIDIKDAYSDAIDIDFSKIDIDNIKVINAGNDCLDVSGGTYKLKYIEINNCEDKGISIGERSYLSAESINLDHSLIGISSKDSSITKIDKANFNNVKYCYEAAQKKQEFYGTILEFNSINCDKNYIIDNNSNVKIN